MTEAHYKFWLIEIHTHSHMHECAHTHTHIHNYLYPVVLNIQRVNSQVSLRKTDGPIYSCAYDNLMILLLPYVLDGSLYLVGI